MTATPVRRSLCHAEQGFLIGPLAHTTTKQNRSVVGPSLWNGLSVGRGGSVVGFGAFRSVDRRFESHSSRRVGTLGKSFTHICM